MAESQIKLNFVNPLSVLSFPESWKMPCLPKNLTETLASLSLNPNVETLVQGTIRKDHELTVDELRIVLKDKLRMLNSLSKVANSS